MMDAAQEVLSHDLYILEVMLNQLEAYLDSDATYWPMQGEGIPKLTIGGCLMRLGRLRALRHRLTQVDQIQLDELEQAFEKLARENVVRFERRSHDELHARLREWTTYLRNASSKMVRDRAHYANTVDMRMVITALMEKLQKPPFRMDAQVIEDVGRMDNYLKAQWQEGEFVWAEVWKEAYPPQNYWWLYGNP